MTIRLDTVRHVGDKHVKAFVTLNEPIKGLTAIATIAVDGRIRNDFEVRPSLVAFGSVEQGQSAVQRIIVTYNGLRDWKLISAKAGSSDLTTQLIENSRAAGAVQYEVLVELKPNVPVGVLRDRLILTTNEIGNPEISIPIEARVEPDIVITDAQFGMVPSGKPKAVTVILRSKKPFQIEKVDQVTRVVASKPSTSDTLTAESIEHPEPRLTDASNAFKTEFSSNVSQIQMLTLTLTPPTDSGMFNEQFSVTIHGRELPIMFRANGRILE